VTRVMRSAGRSLAEVDAVAYTEGPGLAGALLVGAGVANALGWSTVALYLLLALGFAYFQFMKPSTA